MTERAPKMLDVVALLRDVPEAHLRRGQVGTVVEETSGDTVLVEFADSEGRTLALPNLVRQDLLVLDYGSIAAE